MRACVRTYVRTCRARPGWERVRLGTIDHVKLGASTRQGKLGSLVPRLSRDTAVRLHEQSTIDVSAVSPDGASGLQSRPSNGSSARALPRREDSSPPSILPGIYSARIHHLHLHSLHPFPQPMHSPTPFPRQSMGSPTSSLPPPPQPPSQLIHAPLFHPALHSAMENFATDAVLKLCRYVLPVLHASCAFPTVNQE